MAVIATPASGLTAPIIFTDGLAETQTPSGEEFGDERVINCGRGLAGALSAEQLVEGLMQAAASWSARR
jgi:serine phosphatase RsbU (regulator of sigma subunit)